MPDFVHLLELQRGRDTRGMRYDSILRALNPESRGASAENDRPIPLDRSILSALVSQLNSEGGRYVLSAIAADGEHTLLSHHATPLSRMPISGVFYKPRTVSQGDSNIIFKHPTLSGVHPGRIEQIFVHTRNSSQTPLIERTEVFLVVKRLEPISEEDQVFDPYRKYRSIIGGLYYDSYLSDIYILRVEDVLCHFVKTPMGLLKVKKPQLDSREEHTNGNDYQFQRDCAHVRPLDRVRVLACLLYTKAYVGVTPAPAYCTSGKRRRPR